jgi:hypothetical protein
MTTVPLDRSAEDGPGGRAVACAMVHLPFYYLLPVSDRNPYHAPGSIDLNLETNFRISNVLAQLAAGKRAKLSPCKS